MVIRTTWIASFLLLMTAGARAEMPLLGRGWVDHSTQKWVAAVCDDLACTRFSFREGDQSISKKITSSFPLVGGLQASIENRNDYLVSLFKTEYQSSSFDEITILFTFNTQGFGRITSATNDQTGWSWASRPLPLSHEDYESLLDRLQARKELWFKTKQRCKNLKSLFKAVAALGGNAEQDDYLKNKRAIFNRTCVTQKTSEDPFQTNVSKDWIGN